MEWPRARGLGEPPPSQPVRVLGVSREWSGQQESGAERQEATRCLWEEGGKKTARDVRQHATGLGSATETVEEKRSTRGIIRFTGAVKQWPPSVDMARPRVCPECGQPAFEGGRVRIYGHGLVGRQQRGPPGPEQAPASEVLLCRRYLCTGCRAVLTVLPASAQARKHFSGAAIALALTLWGLCGYSAARVRELVSYPRSLGACPSPSSLLLAHFSLIQPAR